MLYLIDPMLDRRWDELVASHPMASIFHHKGWLEALVRTYGYRPMVLTSASEGERLSDGIVFCEVKSWITGSRLVSLPFADHSEPLLNKNGDPLELTAWMRAECRKQNWKYIELRPIFWEMQSGCPLVTSQSFWLHTLSLTPLLDRIFDDFHKSCIQRRIHRAERAQLTYERGSSEALLSDFYRLLMITRRRHRLLPQPRSWFRNLIACMGHNAEIRVARKDTIPVSAMLTLRHRGTVVYKYGCSNEEFHNLAGMPFLFWKLIEESKTEGAEQIDFGRTDLDNDGLIGFKDRFGTTRRQLSYFRYSESIKAKGPVASNLTVTRSVCSVLPDVISSGAARMVYRNIG
jgi:hypothetical protein